MSINTVITDQEGAALAKAMGVRSYVDGNDMIAQVAKSALMRVQKQNIVSSVTSSQDAAFVAAINAAVQAAKKPA